MSYQIDRSISKRANRILNIVLVFMLLIAVRCWHLAVVQHDARRECAQRPQWRHVIEPPARGTIRDRFNLPLAVNRVQYNAAVHYGEIKDIPQVRFVMTPQGREKKYIRRQYIEALSALLARELDLDAGRVEDEIYSYAALFPNVPYIIKSDISEEQYFRLKMLKKNWIGLEAQQGMRRSYPRGPSACHILGHLGSISRVEYQKIAMQIAELERFFSKREEGRFDPIPCGLESIKEARERLVQLRERAYSISDWIGKAGIEGQQEEALHGFCGKRRYLVDIYGNFVRELAGKRPPISGQRVVLNISAELQEFAERLLIENERIRDGRSLVYDKEKKCFLPLKQPWIKGGAIVALEPQTGEVLALAAYPRYDPNDFVLKAPSKIRQWLESEEHIGAIWDGQVPLRREVFKDGALMTEELEMNWEHYLAIILAPDGAVIRALEHKTVSEAISLQRTGEIDLGVASAQERNLILDLCGLCVDERRFSNALIGAIGHEPIGRYRAANRATLQLRAVVMDMMREVFHHEVFASWRRDEGKSFLKNMRKQEQDRGLYQRPFLDYFDQEEKRQFDQFWKRHQSTFLMQFLGAEEKDYPELLPFIMHLRTWRSELEQGAHAHLAWYAAYHQLKAFLSGLSSTTSRELLQSMRSFDELDRTLKGRYRLMRSERGMQTERHLATAFYPRYGFGYARSWAYRQAAPQGSVFKIVTSYAALMQRFAQLSASGKAMTNLNPLVMVDDPHRSDRRSNWGVGYNERGESIPERYKGGRLLRTHRRNVGNINLVEALEVSSNSYFGLLTADHLTSPEDLNVAASRLSYGDKTGIDLPGEYAGGLPQDLSVNLSGLYSYACGQHSLVVTPLQTASMLVAIANGGSVMQPQVVRLIAGDEPVYDPVSLLTLQKHPYQEDLELLGIQFPFWTRLAAITPVQAIQTCPARIQQKWPIPDPVRNLLLDGLQRSVCGARGGARPSLIRAYHDYPWMVRDFRELAGQLIGKTGTAEIREAVDLDPHTGINMYNDLWFAGVSFESQEITPPYFGKPELVVVVLLRFGDYGKEAAPVAAQIVKKWREIKKRNRCLSEDRSEHKEAEEIK